MNFPKIMIVGKMRSGKSVISNRLCVEYGFREVSFGQSLKSYAHQIFAKELVSQGKPRSLYQKFGQLCRDIDDNVWIRHVEESVKFYEDMRSTEGIVISDGRQANELAWAKSNGFIIVRVSASEQNRIERSQLLGDVFDYEDLSHPTETEVDGFVADYEIINDGDYDDLAGKVADLMATIIHP